MITQRGDMLEMQNFGRLVPEQAKSDELLSEDILIHYSKINEFYITEQRVQVYINSFVQMSLNPIKSFQFRASKITRL